MSSAWLTPQQRDDILGWFQSRQPCEEAYENGSDLVAHAELADQIIHELAERLRTKTHASDAMNCDCVPCTADRAVLARVDALGGHDE